MKRFHYTVVRTDLPPGVIAAMIQHASGESAVITMYVPEDTRAGVLAAKDEAALEEVYRHALARNRTPIVRVVETDGPYAGQLMAIGFPPCNRNILEPSLRGLPLLWQEEAALA